MRLSEPMLTRGPKSQEIFRRRILLGFTTGNLMRPGNYSYGAGTLFDLRLVAGVLANRPQLPLRASLATVSGE
jgi:hypothetical protein